MNDTEHIAMVNATLRRLESRKVLDAILADIALISSPSGAGRCLEMGGAPPLLSIGPSGLGGYAQKELY